MRRVVRRFDFEERAEGNFGEMPRHWFRVRGPGLPRHTEIGFDRSHAWSPDHSLKLKLNGGSAAVTLERGVISTVPGARYLVTARVRTERVRRSGARLVVTYFDHRGKPMPATRTVSEPVQSNGGWTALHVEPPPAPEKAGWLKLRLELLQSAEFRRPELGVHQLNRQDLDAAAWFDNVTVYQLPRVELRTQTETNIIRRPEAPRLSVRVHDQTGQPLNAAVRVYDHQGRLVAEQQRSVEPGRPGRWTWEPDLPRLGWYWVDLRVKAGVGDSDTAAPDGAGTNVVGRAVTSFLWMKPREELSRSEAGRFVIAAEDLPDGERSRLPAILKRIGAPSVLLSVWGDPGGGDQPRQSGAGQGEPGSGQDDAGGAADNGQPTGGGVISGEADPLIDRLIRDGRDVMLSFSGVPRAIAEQVSGGDTAPLAVFGGDPAAWEPYLQPILGQYGGEVRTWQLGRAGSGAAFEREEAGRVYSDLQSYFQRYVEDPRLLLPWRATDELPAEGERAGALMMHVPSSVRPDRIVDYAESWPGDREMIYHLGTLGTERYSHEDRATDLALRMLHAWRAGPRRLAIERPWDSAGGGAGQGGRLVPDPLLGVWATLAERLAGRRFVGKLDIGSGRVGYLLDGPDGGMLAAWNREAPEAEAEIRIGLGGSPVATDIWGNRRAVSREDGKHRIRLGRSPLLIEGVDMELARFRAGFRVEPGFLRSEYAVHDAELVVSNPWSQTITGRMRVTGPERWEIQPRLKRFSIPAGQTLRVPVEVSFPVNELAGPKQVTAAFELEADRGYELELHAPVEVGLKGVELDTDLELTAAQDSGGNSADVLITLKARNVGDTARSFYAFALPPDVPRRERIISSLEPGETVVKKFRLADAAEALSGKRIRVGLREIDGPAVLNHELEAP